LAFRSDLQPVGHCCMTKHGCGRRISCRSQSAESYSSLRGFFMSSQCNTFQNGACRLNSPRSDVYLRLANDRPKVYRITVYQIQELMTLELALHVYKIQRESSGKNTCIFALKVTSFAFLLLDLIILLFGGEHILPSFSLHSLLHPRGTSTHFGLNIPQSLFLP
jgi:hypothetical protein